MPYASGPPLREIWDPSICGSVRSPGPVIVGVHVDYTDNHQLFEMVKCNDIH